VEASVKVTGNYLEDYGSMLAKIKFPKNPYFERWLKEWSTKENPEELFVQNLSLDKITLRMLFTLVEWQKLTRFRF